MVKLITRVLILMVAVMFVHTNYCHAQESKLNPVDFNKKLNATPNKQVVDVRTTAEYKQGHLANAKQIDISKDNFRQELSKLDRNIPVFVYCAGGVRSNRATGILKELGFKQVFDLEGGMNAWRSASLPVVNEQ